MSENKKIIIIAASITVTIIIVMLAIYFITGNTNNANTQISEEVNVTDIEASLSESDLDETYDEDVEATINLKDDQTTVEGSGVTVTSNTVTIKTGGTFYISGTLTNGNIIIEASSSSQVKLILSNVSIKSSTTAAIYCKKAEKLIITLDENSSNYLEDASEYVYQSSDEEEPSGTLYSKSDLTINGEGTLEIKANYLDGIVSKDTLKIVNGNIIIDSKDDAIKGKDYVSITGGKIKITALGDGIKSTNDTDSTLGYILIENTDIDIDSENDGIQAQTVLNIKSGNINIVTGGGSSNSNKTTSQTAFYTGKYSGQTTTTQETSSSKAIKASSEITIEGGTIKIDSSDDSIHSNGNVIILGGTIEITSGDDGIHADSNVKIDNGNIDIQKSYEGIEGMYIEINGGTIKIVASDDGMNVAGGNDSSSVNGRMGQNSFNSSNTNLKLVINGGNIEVNATGDGLDSNGAIYITGGTTIVYGPTNSGNGALDYDSECAVSGGTFITMGSTGMAQAPSSTSTQCSFTTALSGSANDVITIKTSEGEEIVTVTAKKSYQIITVSSADIKVGEQYSIYVNGIQKTTVNQSSTTVSSTGGNMGGINRR